jgi:ComF family protein
MTFLAVLRRAAAPLVTYALPPRCPACGAIVEADHIFCLACWGTMRFLGDPGCARCGIPFELPQGEEAECAACLASPPAYDRARAVIGYGDVARHVALKLKYGRRIGLARLIGTMLERHVPVADRAGMLLVPVPLHRWRLWSRGFNQSALIANVLARRTGIAVDRHLLLRDRRTPPLRGMNPAERRRTVRGAFTLRSGADISGRTVLLIDDVLTSGATADACARLLKRGGAASVHLLCWARVLPDARPD